MLKTPMIMGKKRSSGWAIATRILGFVIFIFLLYAFNLFASWLDNSVINQLALFLNDNVIILIGIAAIFLVAEIISVLIFPYNLPAPFFNAVGSLFLVIFSFEIFKFIENLTFIKIFSWIYPYSSMIYFLVFVAILIGGLVSILANVLRENHESKTKDENKTEEKKTWGDVGSEINGTLFEIFSWIRKKFHSGKKDAEQKEQPKKDKKS
jgi:hypothetical protein